MSQLPVLADLLRAHKAFAGEAEPQDAKARTRARLLRAATELFHRLGYRRTSVDDVAREAAVAKGTVYVHFKTKQELLFHAIAEEKKRYLDRVLRLLEEELPPAERLRRYIEFALVTLLALPLVSKLMSGDREMLLFLEDLGPGLREELTKTQLTFLSALLAGVGEMDRLEPHGREERARVLLGFLYAGAALMDERVRSGMTPERYASQLAKAMVEGIGAR